MQNGDAAAHALAEALGAVISGAVENAVKPLAAKIDRVSERMDSLEKRQKSNVKMLAGRIDQLVQTGKARRVAK